MRRMHKELDKVVKKVLTYWLFFNSVFFVSVEACGAELLLRSDFEEESVTRLFNNTHDTINVTFETGRRADLWIFYEDGTYSDRFARVIDDPTRPGNRVLRYWLRNASIPDQVPGRYKGRIQLDLGPDSTEYYQRHRMYLHPDVGLYRSYPTGTSRLMISEMRLGANGDPHVFRITVNLAKEEGINRPLVFHASGSIRTSGPLWQGNWQSVWEETNITFAVPIGRWMYVDIGYRQGNATQGRFYLAVRPEGDARTTIFDITNWTYHPSAPQPIPLTNSSIFKLYASDRIIDHIRDNGGVAQIYWDDLEIWEDSPTEW